MHIVTQHNYPCTHLHLISIATACGTTCSQAVGISVVITFIVTLLIVLVVQVGVTYLIKHVKTAHKTADVPTEAPPQQQQPTPGPIYEEVAPAKEEIELNTNEAYGPVGQ